MWRVLYSSAVSRVGILVAGAETRSRQVWGSLGNHGHEARHRDGEYQRLRKVASREHISFERVMYAYARGRLECHQIYQLTFKYGWNQYLDMLKSCTFEENGQFALLEVELRKPNCARCKPKLLQLICSELRDFKPCLAS